MLSPDPPFLFIPFLQTLLHEACGPPLLAAARDGDAALVQSPIAGQDLEQRQPVSFSRRPSSTASQPCNERPARGTRRRWTACLERGRPPTSATATSRRRLAAQQGSVPVVATAAGAMCRLHRRARRAGHPGAQVAAQRGGCSCGVARLGASAHGGFHTAGWPAPGAGTSVNLCGGGHRQRRMAQPRRERWRGSKLRQPRPARPPRSRRPAERWHAPASTQSWRAGSFSRSWTLRFRHGWMSRLLSSVCAQSWQRRSSGEPRHSRNWRQRRVSGLCKCMCAGCGCLHLFLQLSTHVLRSLLAHAHSRQGHTAPSTVLTCLLSWLQRRRSAMGPRWHTASRALLTCCWSATSLQLS